MTQYRIQNYLDRHHRYRKLRKEEESSSEKSKIRVTLWLINFKKHLPTQRFEILQKANVILTS